MKTQVRQCNHDPLAAPIACGLCVQILKRDLEDTRFHLADFTDRTIAAETKVGDLRKALKRVQEDVQGRVPFEVVEFISKVLEDTK